jgi:hypothetical protein
MKTLKIEAVYTEECLGTNASNPEIHGIYIAGLAADAPSRAEEVAAVGAETVERAGMTVFPKDENGRWMMWDYMVKGMLKHAASALREVDRNPWKGIKNYRKQLTDLLFVEPRKIIFNLPEGQTIGNCQRPLLGQTPQGPRVALANSETLPAGTKFNFSIVMFNDDMVEKVKLLLDYGKYMGLGQWRNSGKGRFTYRIIE